VSDDSFFSAHETQLFFCLSSGIVSHCPHLTLTLVVGSHIDMASLSLTPAAQAPPGSVSDLVNPSGVGFRITITNVVCVVLFMMVVIIRLITRCFLNRSFGHDDCKRCNTPLPMAELTTIHQHSSSLQQHPS
jgi:hypothetical protein